MTGDTQIRLAMAVAVGMGLVLAALILFTGEEEAERAPLPRTSPATAREVSPSDALVLTQMRPSIRDWSVAARAWLRSLGEGRERFLARYEGYTKRMDVSSLRIRLSTARIQNPRLRVLMRRLGDAYRRQFRAVRDTNEAVIVGDELATRAALERMERADDERIDAATRLVDAYPELAGDVSRIR